MTPPIPSPLPPRRRSTITKTVSRVLFKTLDLEHSGRLMSRQMHKYAQTLGYEVDEKEFVEDFDILCDEFELDPKVGAV